MKIGIVGSRKYPNKEIVEQFIFENFYKEDILVSGGAIGVDSWAQQIAESLGIKTEIYYPDYNQFGKIAPLMRNTTIVENCDIVICFWSGNSKGCIDTVIKAKKANKPYTIYGPQGTLLRCHKNTNQL